MVIVQICAINEAGDPCWRRLAPGRSLQVRWGSHAADGAGPELFIDDRMFIGSWRSFDSHGALLTQHTSVPADWLLP